MVLTKEDLRAAFKAIESAALRPSRILMSERDYKDLAGTRCPECEGYYLPTAEGSPHRPDDCLQEKVRQIMES